MDDDLAVAVTAGWLTGGLLLTVALNRTGHRQICHVLRTPVGAAALGVFLLHVFTRRFDIVRVLGGHRVRP